MDHIIQIILALGLLGICCDAVDHIPKAGCNRGTAKEVVAAWFTCDSDVADIPAPVDHIIAADITFNVGEHWYTIGLDKVGSSFNFQSQGEGQSKYYTNTVILFVPGVGPAVSKIVTSLIRGTYNLIIQDKNGNKHLIGALGDGAEVSIQAQNDRNGYVLTFVWESADLPYNYTGAITTA